MEISLQFPQELKQNKQKANHMIQLYHSWAYTHRILYHVERWTFMSTAAVVTIAIKLNQPRGPITNE